MISCSVVPPVGGWYSVLKVRVRWPKDEKTTAFNLLNNFLPISFNQYSLTVSQFNQIVLRYFSTRAFFFSVWYQRIC